MRIARHVATARPEYDHAVDVRVQAEFTEMPGLKLTIPQASRLFALDPTTCEAVLDALVDRGVLATSEGMFMRADIALLPAFADLF